MKLFAGLFTFLTCILLTAPVQSQKPKAPVKKAPVAGLLPMAPEVKIGKLPNGLTYYIRKNVEPKNRAELRLVVKAGSILENDAQLGLAHFTEHMAFNGTKNFEKSELIDFLEKSGVKFGADLNAYTSFDETVYMLPVPTDSMHVFKTAFQILEDWAHNVTFDNTEIDKERGVVIEEWRRGLGAQERMRAKYFPVILKGSQYAKRLPIGTKENLESFKYSTLKSFYKDWYRPDLQAVMVVGDIDIAETEKLIKQHFGSIPKAVNPKPRKQFTVPVQPGTDALVMTDPEQTYNLVQIFYKQKEIKEAKTITEYRAALVRQLFNAVMNERLQDIAQQPDAPFIFGNTNYSGFIGDKDAFTLVAVARDGAGITKATESLIEENERVRQHGFTQGELDRAKKASLSNMESSYNEKDKTKSSQLVGEMIRNFLKNEPMPGIEYEYNLYQKYIPTISLNEVNSLIKQWIKPTDRAILVMGPETEKDKLPTKQQMIAMMNKQHGTLAAHEDKVTEAELLAMTPKAGSVTNAKKVEALGVTELTLSNGVKVILKPTDFKNDEIQFSAMSPGGSSQYSDDDYLTASNASTIALLGGVGNFDYLSLQKELTGKQLFVAPTIGQYSEGISGSSTPKDLETAFQLIHGYFTEARKDDNMFTVMKQQMGAQLKNKGNDPGSVFNDSVSYIMGNYHPRRKPMTVESLDKIDLEKGFKLYKDRFSNAGDFIFTFVGNFTVESITPMIELYIASLPSTQRMEKGKDVGIRYPSGVVDKVIRKGKENKATVRLSFVGTTNYNDLEVTQLDQLADILGIRLREVLREEQGGVYGVGVRANMNREPINSYSITINYVCAVENVDKLNALVFEEINALKTKGAVQVNIDKVQAEGVREMELQVKENSYWLSNLEDKYYYNENPLDILKDAELVKQMTIERSKQMANQYFNTNNMVKLILLPETK